MKGEPMAETSPLASLLDLAGEIFSLAHQLGESFHQRALSPASLFDPSAWEAIAPMFDEFCATPLDLRDAMQNPPKGFTAVAQVLLEAAGIAREIRAKVKSADDLETERGHWNGHSMGRRLGVSSPGPTAFAWYHEFYGRLNAVAQAGRQEVTKARRFDDPFGCVDQPAASKESGIDTTPTLPKPPQALIESALRAIPGILANVQPTPGGAIELVASHLAERLRDAKHTLAAAQWAIHEAIWVGRLQPGLIEVDLPSFGRMVGGRPLFGMPDSRRMEWTGGGKTTIAIPEGKPAPFNSFKVGATDSLWSWWRSLDPAETNQAKAPAAAPENPIEAAPDLPPAEPHAPVPRAKRSTERGEGQAKLIAALTKHHLYADGSCLNVEPIGNNELAKLAGVSASTASAFFNNKFKGHTKYRAVCRDAGRLADSLKALNGEFSPHHLYGRRPPGEDDRDDEGDE
jgi:hypothetical protein